MSQSPIERVLARLPDARLAGDGKWKACCPAHEDHSPSLSIAKGEDGRALVHCFAGCDTPATVQAMGLTLADLMPMQDRPRQARLADSPPRPAHADRPAATPGQTFASAEEAVQFIQRRFGLPAGVWAYHDAQGRPAYVAARWNALAGGKTFRPVVRRGDGRWTIGGQPPAKGWPLYGLPDLLARRDERVYLCEGEKAADAARSIALLATTSPGGSNAAGKADWSPLAGRDVVILPDNDEAGRRYADDVAGKLMKLQPPATVRIVHLPGLPPKGDVVEYLAMQGGDESAAKQAIGKLTYEAQPVSPEQMQVEVDDHGHLTERAKPLMVAFKPFPVDALPGVLSGFVREAARAIGCDPSFIALPLLAAVASAIGNSRRIQLKRGWSEPAVVWTAIIGESGSMKSPAMELALKPLRGLQGQAMREHAREMKEYESQQLTHEKQMANWRKSKAGDAPPEAPQPPICKRYYADDVTIEALAHLLQENQRGLLVVRDELSGWFSFDRYTAKGASGAEAAKWLEVFGARPLVVDRRTSGTLYVPHAAVSVTGGIQPSIFARAIGQQHKENGLLARLLLAMPPRQAKQWTDNDINPASMAALGKLFETLHQLPTAYDADGEPVPALIALSPNARQRWIAFHDQHNEEVANLSGELASAWTKLECYAPRLALIHHMARQASPTPAPGSAPEITPGNIPAEIVGDAVDEQSMEAAIRLVGWFANEARRVYAMLNEDDESRRQRQTVELIQRKGDSVSLRDWQRLRSHPNAKTAQTELDELVQAGVGQWEYTQAGKAGGRPSRRFVLHTQNDAQTNPQASQDEEWGEL